MTHLTSITHSTGATGAIAPWRVVATAAAMSTVTLLSPAPAEPQTIIAEEAYHQRFCGGWFIFRDCQTVATRRITRNFTRQYLNSEIFGGLWGAAAHCLTVTYPERCAQSVAVFSDPSWNRVVWGQTNQFLLKYGAAGDSVGQFQQPAGIAITRNEGEWHVAFIADVIAGRVAVLGLGYTCRCVRWLGAITAAETGIPLSMPFDVAWDPAGTWTLDDDRVFIADHGNDRVVVYQVSLYPALGYISQQYLGSFGTSGTGSTEFLNPQGIEIRSYFGPRRELLTDVFVADGSNQRVKWWKYDASYPGSTAGQPAFVTESAHYPNADFVGITRDHYGDIYVSDRAQNRVIKLQGSVGGTPLEVLKKYGSSSSSWYNGNFVWPTSLEVARSFKTHPTDGTIIEEGLPFLSSLEKWGDTTGLQTHRLGVDVDNLSAEVSSNQSTFYGRFLFTATGYYSWTIRSPSGLTVESSGGQLAARSGWVYPTAYIAGYGYGTYTLTVQFQSGYMYDDGQWRTKTAYVTVENPDHCVTNPKMCEDPYFIAGAPTVYSLSQDQALPATGGLESYRTGLRRLESRGLLVLDGGVIAPGRSTAADVRLNGITGVRFGVPRSPTDAAAKLGAVGSSGVGAMVQIRIYDTRGRLVRTAVNEQLSPGYYQYQWDRLNDRGQRVAPGVYVVMMTAPGFSESSKLIVTR